MTAPWRTREYRKLTSNQGRSCADGYSRGEYGQDYFTLRSTFFQGRPPKSVNMYWRRFAMSSIPLDDSKAFEAWVKERWDEKELLLEHYMQNGRFPADERHESNGELANGATGGKAITGAGYIETEVKLAHWFEVGQMFVVLASFAMLANVLSKFWTLVVHGRFGGPKMA